VGHGWKRHSAHIYLIEPPEPPYSEGREGGAMSLRRVVGMSFVAGKQSFSLVLSDANGYPRLYAI
jgi:hypothetical protein